MRSLLLVALFPLIGCSPTPAQTPLHASSAHIDIAPTPSSKPPPRLIPDAALACVTTAAEPVTLANWAEQYQCKDAAERIFRDCREDYKLGQETCLKGCDDPEWVARYSMRYEFPLWCKVTRNKCDVVKDAYTLLGSDMASRGARQIGQFRLACITERVALDMLEANEAVQTKKGSP